jgi:predicted Zn-dependent protease
VVDGGRDRHLKDRAGALGFDELGAYLQARCDAGHSIPRIATELGVRDWQVEAALARSGVRLAPRPQRLAAQRRRYTEERIAARVVALGFADVGMYLVDRVLERGWLLAEVAAELAAHRVTVRRLLARHGIRRVRRTTAERAASKAGLRVQSVGWQARRAARLAELGFADLAAYLRARQVEQGWSVRRMRAELGVGRRWLVGELARLGLRP